MITVKVNNGVVGWLNAVIAAEACYNARTTALQGFGKIWTVQGSLRLNMGPAVKKVKAELDAMVRIRGLAVPELV
jgi:hypothetical protein